MTEKRRIVENELYLSYVKNGLWLKETQFERLEICAERTPDKLAVTDDERALTFSELTERSRAYAAFFLSKGLKKGDIVIIQHINAVSFAELLFAFFKIGVIVLPMLPSYREIEIEGIIRLVEPRLYISVDEYMGFDYKSLAEKCIAETDPDLPLMLVSEVEKIDISGYSLDDYEYVEPEYNDPSVIVSSSGSTGIPKMIQRCHANYINSEMTCADSIVMTSDDIDLIPMSLMHNWNLCGPGLIGSLIMGCTVVLAKYNTPDEIIRLTEKYKATVVALVPALVQACLEYRKFDDSEDISSLRVIQIGGSVCPPELVKRSMDVFGCAVQQIYGMGEGFVSATAIDDDYDTIVNTQGFPVAEGTEIKLVDSDGNTAAPGNSGELLVRGPSCVTEYYKSEQFSSQAFTDELFFRTGDEAILTAEGRIKILGRMGDLINRCGEKITPSEVEELLLKIEGVSEAAVVGGKDKELGQRICAFVTSADKSLSIDKVRSKLADMGLASFKLPDRFEILEEMPHTGVNKIDKKILKIKADQE